MSKKDAAKSILVILRNPGYGSHGTQEALDVILTCAAFGQKVSVLFMDDAVTLLLKLQDTDAIDQKSIVSQIEAFGVYDIENKYVCQHSLEKRSLDIDELTDGCSRLDDDGLKALMDIQDLVMRL